MKDSSLYSFGIAVPEGYVIALGIRKTMAPLVVVHWEPSKKNQPHQKVWRLCRLKIIENAITYGCLTVDSYRIDTAFSMHLKPAMWDKIYEYKRNGKMYYMQIDGILEGFATIRTRDLVHKIVTAARKRLRVRVFYLKKGNGRVVKRTIAAYSFEDGYLNVTDTIHGNKKIRTYDTANIKSAVTLKTRFKAEWKIEL